ncbi:CRISPR-associated protein Cas5 [Gluconobacter thailandicus]|uniref:type I-E CRISPR-associated protein Cas5/CasD n=1 Tax=Gluconobacter thailandicus TaxID=257438 RepID=UPI0007775AFF|nr:type I-E CRISPR-associated protein Cas5/CasD [Gluconobacter thailandicus]KXV33281.1 CRISPR-associated protein Cas5 [Gluconobacter thailandicus]
MPRYLTFALIAPLSAFGGVAVGERRDGFDRPARSAILGLVAACLGLTRDDPRQDDLARDYGLALLCHAPGQLLTDFHTAQMPSAQRNTRFRTRAQELATPDLNTTLSRRDYRAGSWHLGALWLRTETAPWSLDDLVQAMRTPVFTPYLGRKSCPLGLPLAPDLQDHENAVSALRDRYRQGPEGRLSLTSSSSPQAGHQERTTLRHTLARTAPNRRHWAEWDRLTTPAEAQSEHTMRHMIVMDQRDADQHGLPDETIQTVFRRDQPRSRTRWQFDLREEAVMTVPVL